VDLFSARLEVSKKAPVNSILWPIGPKGRHTLCRGRRPRYVAILVAT
jgi:hypothetical protein